MIWWLHRLIALASLSNVTMVHAKLVLGVLGTWDIWKHSRDGSVLAILSITCGMSRRPYDVMLWATPTSEGYAILESVEGGKESRNNRASLMVECRESCSLLLWRRVDLIDKGSKDR